MNTALTVKQQTVDALHLMGDPKVTGGQLA